jgi:DnaJ-class molecular chaperone
MRISFIFRHPDKNKNENAESKFVEVNKAYEVLSIFSKFE